MIKETNATKEYLKAITGKFDIETIFVLNLKEKNLTKPNAIVLCLNLTVLNLSYNKLNSVSGMGALKDLKFLDLSYNQITNIDDLEYLSGLKNLKLQGNKIDMPKNFAQRFKNLVYLEKLAF
jgi:internalin A